jgi:hypothetical protein
MMELSAVRPDERFSSGAVLSVLYSSGTDYRSNQCAHSTVALCASQ